MENLETHYDGYHFRSRLEARWAVFYNHLGIPYAYEHQGFELDNGEKYLPDFWLPDMEYWIEIKGKRPTTKETVKAQLLSRGTNETVYLSYGNVQRPQYSGHAHSSHMRYEPDGYISAAYWWTQCPQCGWLDLCLVGRCHYLDCGCIEDAGAEGFATPDLIRAYMAARSARF